jgi:hypothetical protein
VAKRRAGQRDPVDQRHREAEPRAVDERPQQPARRRAVQIEPVVHARVDHRHHVRLSAGNQAGVSDQALVEDRVDRVAVVRGALGMSADGRFGGLDRGSLPLAHRLPAARTVLFVHRFSLFPFCYSTK